VPSRSEPKYQNVDNTNALSRGNSDAIFPSQHHEAIKEQFEAPSAGFDAGHDIANNRRIPPHARSFILQNVAGPLMARW
jgi:hypothetical protein